ncbi:GDP-mannose 4,6-dehydratase [Patescibacteria group bacterium]
MKALVTGGAGFIGANLVNRLCQQGWKVTLVDNLVRKGTKQNLTFLRRRHPSSKLKVETIDIQSSIMSSLLLSQDAIFHLAAQTAVTTSIKDPLLDFESNTQATVKLLEILRKARSKTPFIFASTNKVYGAMEKLKYVKLQNSYRFKDYPKGVDESFPVDFYTPYGCSKGSADSYVHDYFRIYDLPTVVFRQSCIYGPMQFGIEDQGWLAHLGLSYLLDKTIRIFGDGIQTRDILFIDDLLDAFFLSLKNINKVKGEVFNIGGGAKNAISVLGYLSYLEERYNKKPKIVFKKERPGDQKVFIANSQKAAKMLGWKVKTGYKEGLPVMLDWIEDNKKILSKT